MYKDVSSLLLSIALLVGCGVVKPTYKPYESEGDSASRSDKSAGEEGSDSDSSCEAQALDTFNETVLPSITQTCGACHGPGGQSNGTLALPPGDAAEAQSNLWAYTGGDANKLIDKLSPGGNHEGEDLIGVAIEAANISTWVDAKAGCL